MELPVFAYEYLHMRTLRIRRDGWATCNWIGSTRRPVRRDAA